MKTFLLALLIFALLTSGIFINIGYLTNILSEIRTALYEIPLPSEGEKDLSLQILRLNQLKQKWEKHSPYISITVNHADLMEVETQFSAAIGAARAGTRENYIVSLSQLDYALSHLIEMAQASIKNVITNLPYIIKKKQGV